MPFTHTLTEKLVVGNTSIEKSNAQSAGANTSIDETIADSTTDGLINFTLDVSQLQSIYIVSDADITIETNDGSSPADTLSLVAGVPYVWHADSYHACLLTTDITAIYVTNASGGSARLQIEALHDPTP